MKISGAPYFGSIRAASEAIGCDARTLLSAINGNPVFSKTAKRICKTLELESSEVLGTEADIETLVDELEHKMNKLIESKADAVMEVQKVINSILKPHEGVGSINDIIDVLRVVIYAYAMRIALQKRDAGELHDTAFFFVDQIAFLAKSLLYSELSGLHRFTESDETTK